MAVWVVMVVGMLVLWDDMCYGYGGEQSVIVGNSLVVECGQGGDYSTLKAVDVVLLITIKAYRACSDIEEDYLIIPFCHMQRQERIDANN
ncbi:hypothetical protein OIU74_021419 [Salix koriyanagi]|uniref:Uncharacterized protein n=1 Tax=Salix koriyanagi TaxID=2511006 RepID=A0A9Q1ADU9_9ROSI|nr:hypothetical protein OIU74_021419 [Salix koriyanagi]